LGSKLALAMRAEYFDAMRCHIEHRHLSREEYKCH
jgi:hypothetical protein